MEAKQMTTGNIESVCIPDTDKTIKILDHIYEVIERMNPDLKDLTEFTELLTAFKHCIEHTTNTLQSVLWKS